MMHRRFRRNASLILLLALSGVGCDRALRTSSDAGANGAMDAGVHPLGAAGAGGVAGATGVIAGAGTSAGGGAGSSAGGNAGGPPCTTIPFVDELNPGDVPAPECPSSDFEVQTDIAYAPGPAHLLDLRLPLVGMGPFPTVIWIHGDDWDSGDKSEEKLAERVLCHGYAMASINYRLASEGPFPAQVQDIKAAVRFLRANADQFNLEQQHFGVFGSAAGGHLAALVGTSNGEAQFEDATLGNAATSSDVQSVVDWYGPVTFASMDQELTQQGCDAIADNPNSPESHFLGCTLGTTACAGKAALADPLTHIDNHEPPFLIAHGTADCIVPLAQSEHLYNALHDAGNCATRAKITGAGHGGAEFDAFAPQDLLIRYLDETLSR